MVDQADKNFFRLHDEDFTKMPHALVECYDPSGRVMGVVHGHIGGVLPYYDTLHKPFQWTLFPKAGDSSYIRGYAKNLLWFISKRNSGKVDVMDLLYHKR